MYTIIDLETTGFSPARGDKIIEVAAIKLDQGNNIVDRFSTLVNPNRDISNYEIHGIEPSLVKKAPLLDEIAPYLKALINGSTLVAHNAGFDLRFLNAELFEKSVDGICTIKLSRLVEPDLPNRKLSTLCNYYDIEIGSSHQAFDDALATAKLFSILKRTFIYQYSSTRFFDRFDCPVAETPSESNIKRLQYTRSDGKADRKKERQKIDVFLDRLPTETISKNDAGRQEYLDTLNKVLADRIISDKEIQTLHELSQDFQLSRQDIRGIHLEYMREVIQVYLIDGILSDFEYKDLRNLSNLLGIGEAELENLINAEEEKASSTYTQIENNFKLKGKSICFTGKLESKIDGTFVSRSTAQKFAQRRGMIIKKNVSHKLDYLVAAKPNSMSGKAKKARKYDIPIIAEAEFWKMIGINVE